jgi:hypothetical protein
MSNVSKIYGEIGMAGLWRGLGTRIFMIGTLTGILSFFKGFKVSNGGYMIVSRPLSDSKPLVVVVQLLRLRRSIETY